MKNNLLILLVLLLSFSCNKTEEETIEKQNLPENSTNEINFEFCMTQKVLENQMKKNPRAFELFEKKLAAFEAKESKELVTLQSNNGNKKFFLTEKIITIPVHINILYNKEEENISDAQIQSQIDVLNQDFSAKNSDYDSIPEIFKSVASGDIKIRFTWDPATGTTRKYTSKLGFTIIQAQDERKSSNGGINATRPNKKLNIWICTSDEPRLGGFATPPALFTVILEGLFNQKSGVTINNTFFVNTQIKSVLTHEVGHWLGLWHTFGGPSISSFTGNPCLSTDKVSDTPQTTESASKIPEFPTYNSTCPSNNIVMTMNYMDYAINPSMFTLGQKKRMRNMLKIFRTTFYF